MKLHEIKLNINFCDAVLNGEKTFEIRRNDRGYQRGDYVRFTATDFDKETEEFLPCGHEVDDHIYEIDYVLSGWGLRDGYVAFAIKDIGTVGYDEAGNEIMPDTEEVEAEHEDDR